MIGALNKPVSVALLLSPLVLINDGSSYLSSKNRMYYTHPIGKDKRKNIPPWFRGFIKKSFYSIIKPFSYEPVVEKRLNMPNSLRWNINEENIYREFEKKKRILKSKKTDDYLFLYAGYPNLPPPNAQSASLYKEATPLIVETKKTNKRTQSNKVDICVSWALCGCC